MYSKSYFYYCIFTVWLYVNKLTDEVQETMIPALNVDQSTSSFPLSNNANNGDYIVTSYNNYGLSSIIYSKGAVILRFDKISIIFRYKIIQLIFWLIFFKEWQKTTPIFIKLDYISFLYQFFSIELNSVS